MFKNNWAHWSYDGVANNKKEQPTSKFDFQLSILETSISHRDSLVKTAIEVYEEHKQLDVLFSGGINSQIILQTYNSLKIPVNVKIFRYENNLNYQWDVAAAVKFCNDLNIKYELIDFNLKKFFEQEAYDVFKKCYTFEVTNLPLMKMLDYCDNVPVLGTGYPHISRSNFYYDSPGSWNLQVFETDFNISSYATAIDRPAVANWFFYSGYFLGSLLKHAKIKNLISDQETAVFSSQEIRNKIYDLHIPIRLKQKGFEDQSNGFLYPDYMRHFFQEYIGDNVDAEVIKFPLQC